MVANLTWKSSFMHTTFHCSFLTKACGPIILLKVVLASSKATFVASIDPSLEIPSCSWISTCTRILPSSFTSQVHGRFRNKSSIGIVHCRLNKLCKLARLAHLSLLESIFIHCNIFWPSFVLEISLFLIGFSTCSSINALPFCFIMVIIYNLKH